MVFQYMFLSSYDEVTNVLCVSLLSHDRYQYDSLILPSDTGGLPELLPSHKTTSLLKFLAPVADRLPCRWRFTISSSEKTRYKSNGVRSSLNPADKRPSLPQQQPFCFSDLKGADVVLTSRKKAWKKVFIFPVRYCANCVSTTVTVLIMHKAESVCFFYSNPVYYTGQLAVLKRLATSRNSVQYTTRHDDSNLVNSLTTAINYRRC